MQSQQYIKAQLQHDFTTFKSQLLLDIQAQLSAGFEQVITPILLLSYNIQLMLNTDGQADQRTTKSKSEGFLASCQLYLKL